MIAVPSHRTFFVKPTPGTQTTEPVVSVSIQTDQVNIPTQSIAIQHLMLTKINFQTDKLSRCVHNTQTDAIVKEDAICDCPHPSTCSLAISTEENPRTQKAIEINHQIGTHI